jgi:hypothetical protein
MRSSKSSLCKPKRITTNPNSNPVTEMFVLHLACDIDTKEIISVWNNQEKNEIVLLKGYQVQSFVDRLFRVSRN